MRHRALLKKIIIGVIHMAFFLSVPYGARAASVQYVAMIMLDGFRRDYLAMYDLPNLRRLVGEGTWVAEAKDVFPANTTPNQVSFVTGSVPAVTGVPNNKYYDRALGTIIASPRKISAPTIVDIFKEAGLSTAVVNHFPVLGTAQYNAPGTANRVDAAVSLVKAHKPSLLIYYNAYVDAAGHKHGPYSQQTRHEAENADKELGELVEAYRAAGILKSTLFVITSDHGMASNAAPAIPQNLVETLTKAGFKVWLDNMGKIVPPETDLVLIQIGSSFIYVKNQFLLETYTKLLSILTTMPDIDVYDRSKLRDLGCDPDMLGDIVVAPKPGLLMVPGSGKGGLHGRPQDSDIIMVFSGAGIKDKNIIKDGSIIDIVPTILHARGLQSPPTVTGQILNGVFK